MRAATEAVAARDRFAVALAGGSTPRGLYALLADPSRGFRGRVAWERVEVFFGDERQVPPDHPESNYRMAMESLLSKVPIPAERVHRVRGENPDADRAAEEYESILAAAFRLAPRERPRFDFVLLGMGADGHTASLFPGSPALDETERLAVAVRGGAPALERVTLTLPVLNAAAAVVFLVGGAGKARALAEVAASRAAPVSAAGLPAARVRPADGSLLVIADRAAASRVGA